MGKFAVVLEDPTSHGGKVSSASSSFEIEGKNAALLNDIVTGYSVVGVLIFLSCYLLWWEVQAQSYFSTRHLSV